MFCRRQARRRSLPEADTVQVSNAPKGNGIGATGS